MSTRPRADGQPGCVRPCIPYGFRRDTGGAWNRRGQDRRRAGVVRCPCIDLSSVPAMEDTNATVRAGIECTVDHMDDISQTRVLLKLRQSLQEERQQAFGLALAQSSRPRWRSPSQWQVFNHAFRPFLHAARAFGLRRRVSNTVSTPHRLPSHAAKRWVALSAVTVVLIAGPAFWVLTRTSSSDDAGSSLKLRSIRQLNRMSRGPFPLRPQLRTDKTTPCRRQITWLPFGP